MAAGGAGPPGAPGATGTAGAGADLAARCREAVQKLEAALGTPSKEIKEVVDKALRAAIGLRDGLIDQVRAGEQTTSAPLRRAALDKVNVAVSLIVGVEYPQSGVERTHLESARAILQQVLADGLA